MKNIILTILSILFTISIFSQDLYKTSSLGKISVVTKTGDSQGDIYLDLKEDGTLGLSLNEKQTAKFVEFLKNANSKFKEWDKVAKENDVKELRKDYDEIRFPGFFRYVKWKFGLATLKAVFRIKEGKTSGYIYIPSFESSSNQFIKSKGHLFYVNDELVSEMENYLSKEKIDKFIKEKSNKADLFKN